MDAPTSLALCTLITQGGVIAAIVLTQRHATRERNELKSDTLQAAGKVATAAEKVATTLESDKHDTIDRLDKIHVLVNSRLTLAIAAIAVLKQNQQIPLSPEEAQALKDAHEMSSTKDP
jgi:hypothetical protein